MSEQTRRVMKNYEAASPAQQHVVYMLVLLLTVYPKSNRGQGGRFRKPLSTDAYMSELLTMMRSTSDMAGEEEQAEIDRWLAQLAVEGQASK